MTWRVILHIVTSTDVIIMHSCEDIIYTLVVARKHVICKKVMTSKHKQVFRVKKTCGAPGLELLVNNFPVYV